MWHTQSDTAHSPQSQIRLARNLYLEPVYSFSNMSSARNVCPTFLTGVDYPALPCLEKKQSTIAVCFFFFSFHFLSAFNQLYPLRTESLDLPLEMFAPWSAQSGNSRQTPWTPHSWLSNIWLAMPVGVLAKWGKGHGCHEGTLTAQKHQTLCYSEVQWWGESRCRVH